jgi:hypothetical protein
MSFIITVYVREGIVMATDSRLTLTTQLQQPNLPLPMQALVPSTDSNRKLFASESGIGIATHGAASIGPEPIADIVDSFIREKLTDLNLGPDEAAQLLLDYFVALPNPPDSHFHVAGYKTEGGKRIQHVWSVSISARAVSRINPNGIYGASWGGEAETMSRLFGQMFTQNASGGFDPLPAAALAWHFFTLQDAIDFAGFAVRATINFIRFLPRAQTVGGPIDVLLLRAGDHRWLNKKELHFTE